MQVRHPSVRSWRRELESWEWFKHEQPGSYRLLALEEELGIRACMDMRIVKPIRGQVWTVAG